MKSQATRRLSFVLVAVLGTVLRAGPAAAEAPPALGAQAACKSLVPAAIGGPQLPASSNAIVLRWLGTMNYELAYRGHVFLLDTFYDRGPRNRPIGFTPSQVTHADAIFIGHAHFDHISDVGPVAAQTKAPVIGAAISTRTAIALGVPAQQTITVANGDVLHEAGVRVDVALARHSSLDPQVLATTKHLFELQLPAPSDADLDAEKAVLARGTFAPEVITEGTMAYVFTFDTGFRVLFLDSAGPITDGDRQLAAKVGHVNVAIIAYQGNPVAEVQVPVTLGLIALFKPDLYIPGHHDEAAGTFLDLGLEPLFEKMRDTMPNTKTIYPLLRSPICLNISSKKL
jgi:L-ascorbate metabolism protein UlaG (beta-lactamase superfamily)